jgi:xanthine dehydrogenase YagS FAD-binding subunit
MKNFEYVRAGSLQDAIESARPASSQYIAGGTELLNWMRLGIAAPDRIVDIGALGAQGEIRRSNSELIIGALATLNDIGEHALIRQHAAVLGAACLKAASAQIRNRATIGGNILQKTRCTYFRSEAPVPWPCNKRAPGSGCAALGGLNERHAILGWTDACVAVHPSDPAVALACLDAQVDLLGPRGRRSVAVTNLLLTQEEARQERSRSKSGLHEALLESRLQPGEIITAYRIPIVDNERSAYVKVRERESYEYALVSTAAALIVNDGRIDRVRIALGSVAQKPWRLTAAEQSLKGAALTREAVLPAIRASLNAATPLEHNAYKVEMAANAATRAVAIAGGFA